MHSWTMCMLVLSVLALLDNTNPSHVVDTHTNGQRCRSKVLAIGVQSTNKGVASHLLMSEHCHRSAVSPAAASWTMRQAGGTGCSTPGRVMCRARTATHGATGTRPCRRLPSTRNSTCSPTLTLPACSHSVISSPLAALSQSRAPRSPPESSPRSTAESTRCGPLQRCLLSSACCRLKPCRHTRVGPCLRGGTCISSSETHVCTSGGREDKQLGQPAIAHYSNQHSTSDQRCMLCPCPSCALVCA